MKVKYGILSFIIIGVLYILNTLIDEEPKRKLSQYKETDLKNSSSIDYDIMESNWRAYFESDPRIENITKSACVISGRWFFNVPFFLDLLEIKDKKFGYDWNVPDTFKCVEDEKEWHKHLNPGPSYQTYYLYKYYWFDNRISFYIVTKEPNLPDFSIMHKYTRKRIDNRFLCRIKVLKNCFTNQFAEVIDGLWAFSPIYAERQADHLHLYRNHIQFKYYLRTIGIPMVTIEGGYENQTFLVTGDEFQPWEFRVNMNSNLYLRENLINVAARKLPHWEYLLWIDAHQLFGNLYWWEEAIYKMEHLATVELYDFVTYISLCNNTKMANTWSFQKALSYTSVIEFFVSIGNAWGVRKEIYDKVGYIVDDCVAGACDTIWNIATCKNKFCQYSMWIHPIYFAFFDDWVENARKHMAGKGGYIRGDIVHLYHKHYFDYQSVLSCFGIGKYSMKGMLERDEDFQLHLLDHKSKEVFDNLRLAYPSNSN